MSTDNSSSKPSVETAIDNVLSEMAGYDANSDDYAKMVVQLEKLYKLKEIDKPKRVSPDTLAIVAGNLAGVFMILTYERTHIVATKALSFVLKTPLMR